MEDKKVLEFINKHHEESYKDHVKIQIKRRKKDLIQCIMLFLAFLSLVIVLGSTIKQDTQKAVKTCLKKGYSESYCLRSL